MLGKCSDDKFNNLKSLCPKITTDKSLAGNNYVNLSLILTKLCTILI